MHEKILFLMQKPLLSGYLLVLIYWPHTSGANQPSSYNQCLNKTHTEKNIIDKTNLIAIRDTQIKCHNKFPDGKVQDIDLSNKIIQKLEIVAGFGWGIFSGSIYNGNNDYTVTHLIISMTPIGHNHHNNHAKITARKAKQYGIDIQLSPLTKGALSVALDAQDAPIHKFEWVIIKAYGHKTP